MFSVIIPLIFNRLYESIYNYCGARGKEPACQCRRPKILVWSQGLEGTLEEGTASHSIILAWRIPWTEEPGGPQSMRSQKVRHDWSNLAAAALIIIGQNDNIYTVCYFKNKNQSKLVDWSYIFSKVLSFSLNSNRLAELSQSFKILNDCKQYCHYSQHWSIEYTNYFCCCLVANSCPTLLWPHELYVAHQALFVHGNFPSKNTGMGYLFLLQGIFLIQWSNLHLLHCRWIVYDWATWEAHTNY